MSEDENTKCLLGFMSGGSPSLGRYGGSRGKEFGWEKAGAAYPTKSNLVSYWETLDGCGRMNLRPSPVGVAPLPMEMEGDRMGGRER